MPSDHPSSDTPTLEVASPSVVNSGSGSHPDGPCCKVKCEGDTSHLSKETHALLRSRLRIASLMLALGFGAFFVRNLFVVDYNNPTQVFMQVFEGLVTLGLLVVGGGMCHKRTYKLSTLRPLNSSSSASPPCSSSSCSGSICGRSDRLVATSQCTWKCPRLPGCC